MRINKEIPLLTVYSPNKQDILCSVAQPKHAKITYNFNSCSTLQFQVDKNIFDSKTGKWIENPCYNDLAENNLLYMANASNVLNYSGYPLLADGSYVLRADSDQPVKYRNQSNWLPSVKFYKPSFVDGNATLQDEEQAFDVGGLAGYPYKQQFELETRRDGNNNYITKGAGYVGNVGSVLHMCVEHFFPVKVGDVIFMGSKTKNGAFSNDTGYTTMYSYTLYFYSNDSEDSCTKYGQQANRNANSNSTYNPATRYLIKDGDFGYDVFTDSNGNTKSVPRKEGFVRFDGTSDGSSLPWAGYTYIIDGERRVYTITLGTKANLNHSIPWFVIQDVQEVKDGRGVHKTVTAYSYEYTLSKRNFSVDESRLPLYIPDEIVEQVTDSNWIVDTWESSAGSKVYTRGSQRMRRGIINQILDYLPEWKIGYVSSSSLITKYKPIQKADNTNIYSYLMNEVQKLYGCYILFNTEDMTINLISQSDIFNKNAGTVISWRNALKALTISNQNTKYITALKVNCDSDNYGISLVNPNGSNVIYNFDSVMDKLDYVADDTHINPDTNNPYTLAELVTKYKTQYAANYTDYRNLGKSLITATKEMEKYKQLLADSLAAYQKVVNENNNKVSMGMPPIPQDNAQFTNGGEYVCYWGNGDLNYRYASSTYYDLIYAANVAYWNFYSTYTDTVNSIAQKTDKLKEMALPLSFNYKTLSAEWENNQANYRGIFTPTEIKELYKFIYEGDWESPIITFDDSDKANDIYNSLLDMFNTAKTEMDNIYSKPIYEFSAEIADIFRMKETRAACDSICLGNSLYIADGDNWITPILLQVNVDFDNMNGTTMLFSTDYKRKPLEYRFSKLFATIQQTSVSTPKYTFD